MPTPASAAIVAMGTRRPSRCTAPVAARTRASWLRAASLRGSRELRMAVMCLLNLSLPPPVRALHLNLRNPPDFARLIDRAHRLTATAIEAARRQQAVSAGAHPAR